MQIEDLIVYQKTIPSTPPQYAPYPSGLSEEICSHLSSTGIKSLYTHQAEMFTQAMQGKNIVITTSTASGKTLGFLLPVIQEILTNPQARAFPVSYKSPGKRPIPGNTTLDGGIWTAQTVRRGI